eukprot:gene7389-7598_t
MPVSQAAMVMLLAGVLSRLDDDPDSSSSSSRCDGADWSVSGPLHIRDVVVPLLLTLVEGEALEERPDLTRLSAAVPVMTLLVQSHQHWLCQQQDHQQQVATVVLPAVVQLVLPAVQAAEAAGERPPAILQLMPGVPVRPGEVLQQLSTLIAVLLKSLMSTSGDPTITDTVTATAFNKLIQQHPEQMIRLLEIFVQYSSTNPRENNLPTTAEIVTQLMWAVGQPTCRSSTSRMLLGPANGQQAVPTAIPAAELHKMLTDQAQLRSDIEGVWSGQIPPELLAEAVKFEPRGSGTHSDEAQLTWFNDAADARIAQGRGMHTDAVYLITYSKLVKLA